jgi:DNA (cytosine-5)-methyltransferase 1
VTRLNTRARTIALCAGPGGSNMGGRILGLEPMAGVDLDADACATGAAAGFERHQLDIRTLSPHRHRGVTGVVVTTPCPTLSDSGLRSGRADMQEVLDAVTCMGVGCGCDWQEVPGRVQDIRTALLIEAARWALFAPDLEWIVCENVPAVEYLWEDVAAELYANGWEWVDVVKIEAYDYGIPSRRPRCFLVARRYAPSRLSAGDVELPRRSMAGALGLPRGLRVWTRGDRKTSGGNTFSADDPSWCLTGSTRSWKIGAPDGRELTAGEAGLLNGFPADYPWRGSRTKQFLQIADVVAPAVAAVALGIATDTPWEEPVRAYLHGLYGGPQADAPPSLDELAKRRRPRKAPPGQASLFDLLESA